jgi:glycosyltransferase involved in cell wall biosynthesis
MISVILPVFNGAQFIAAAIKSVVAQTYGDFELLVIDDGSTDGSAEVIRGAIDERCRLIQTPNRGIVAACNLGLEQAKGKYIFRMDADDVCHSERFAKQHAYLEDHPRCVAVGSAVMFADPDMRPLRPSVPCLTHAEIDGQHMRGVGGAITHPAAAMRRSALLQIGGYRAEYEWAEDLDLFLRLAEVGELANLSDVLLTYRQHLGSVSHSRRDLQVARAKAAVNAAHERRGVLAMPVSMTPERSHAEVHRTWAWWALHHGHAQTARKHALKAARLEPLASAKLLVCAIRGY